MVIKHFLQFRDFTRDEFEYVYERTRWIKNEFKSVSYTHLDVYKRQERIRRLISHVLRSRST